MRRLGGSAALAVAAAAPPGWAQPCYRLESSVTLRATASNWNCAAFDSARGYLFIGGRGVTVFDVHAQKVVRTIDLCVDANAVTLIPEFDRGYTANIDGTTTVFQLSTFRSIARIHLGTDGDSAFYDPVTRQVAFTMGSNRKIVFVDARTARPTGDLNLDAELGDAVPDGEGRLFIALRDRNCVALIDAANHRLDGLWPIDPCEEPTAVAFDQAGKQLFVGCRGRNPALAVLDASSGKLIATLQTGQDNDGVAFDAATRRMALDPVTRKVYLVTDTFTVLTYAPRRVDQRSKSSGRSSIGCPCGVRSAA